MIAPWIDEEEDTGRSTAAPGWSPVGSLSFLVYPEGLPQGLAGVSGGVLTQIFEEQGPLLLSDRKMCVLAAGLLQMPRLSTWGCACD